MQHWQSLWPEPRVERGRMGDKEGRSARARAGKSLNTSRRDWIIILDVLWSHRRKMLSSVAMEFVLGGSLAVLWGIGL